LGSSAISRSQTNTGMKQKAPLFVYTDQLSRANSPELPGEGCSTDRGGCVYLTR